MMQTKPSQLGRTYFSVFFGSVGLAHVLLIPAFAQELGASYLELGYIGMLRSVPYMFLPVVVGYLGDRFDKQSFYLSSLFVTGIAMLALSLTRTIQWIFIVQLLLGVGFSLFWPLSEAIVLEAGPLRERPGLIGLYGVAWGLGFFAGPLLGGLIADTASFSIAFLVAGAVILTTGMISTARTRGSSKKHAHEPGVRGRPSWQLVLTLTPALIISIPYALVFSFATAIYPGYASQSGLTPAEVGAIMSAFGFGRISMFLLSTKLRRIGEGKCIIIASAGIASVFALVPMNRSYVALLIDSCLLGMFFGILYPQVTALISKRSPLGNLGFVMGIYEAIFGIGLTAGPIVFGFIAESVSTEIMYFVLAATALSIVPMVILWRSFERYPPTERTSLDSSLSYAQ